MASLVSILSHTFSILTHTNFIILLLSQKYLNDFLCDRWFLSVFFLPFPLRLRSQYGMRQTMPVAEKKKKRCWNKNTLKSNEKSMDCGHYCVYWQNTVNVSVFGNSITKVATIIWCFFFHFYLNVHSRLISLARNWIVLGRKWQHKKKTKQNRPKYSKHFIQIHSHSNPSIQFIRHKTMTYLDRLAYYLI